MDARVAGSRATLLALHRLPFGRLYRVMGLWLYVPPGVFDPLVGVSSLLLARLARRLARGRVLEVGCGSGLVSLAAALNPNVEVVVGYDISPKAVAACRVNARLNRLEARTIFTVNRSAALKALKGQADTVVVNPPYLPCSPSTAEDLAWCGGSRLEHARSLIREALQALRDGGLLLLAYSTLTAPKPLASLLCYGGKDRFMVVEAEAIKLPGEEVRAVALKVGGFPA